MKIYNNAVEITDLVVTDESYRYRAIMGENSLTITFSLPEFIEIPVGSYVNFQGEIYTLQVPQNFTKNNSESFEYTLILQSAKSLLSRYKFRDSGSKRLKFSFTAKPSEHLEMLVWNLNQRDSGWSVGDCIDSAEKVISFNHTNCDEALRMISEAFKTEYEVIGKVISLKKVEYNKTAPLALSYGFGNGFKSGVKRDNFNNSKSIEILFVQGGEKNIDATAYGSQELLLPKSQELVYEGRTYVSDENGYSIRRKDKPLSTHIEDSLDLSNIYPSRVGVISDVIDVDINNNFYDFIDTSIPNDLNFTDCLIAGEKMTVIFQSGMLSGREFDVSYKHSTRKFEIVPQDIDGIRMPNETFKPVENDKYAVFGINLPEAYVCDNTSKTGGSWDMFREAAKYMFENEDPRFSFTGELDGIWSKSDWLNVGGKIKLGGFVSFTDEQFQSTPVLIRIVGIKDYINNPYSPQIELSNVTVGSSTSSAIKDLPTKEVAVIEAKKETIRFAKRGFREAKETLEMVKGSLLENFTGSINPITVQTMQIIAGDESLQFKFVNSKTTPVEVSHSIAFDKDTKILSASAGIVQHMTLGITSVSSSHAVSEYKFWDVPAFESPYLDQSSKSYWLYLKCSKLNQTATFVLSDVAIAIESVAGYYHLLVGMLNSEFEGDRSWSEMYGYSELTPSRLTIKKIVSPTGGVYFDLEKNNGEGEIGGHIKFVATDGSYKTVEQAIGDIKLGGRNYLIDSKSLIKSLTTNPNQFQELGFPAATKMNISFYAKVNSGTGAILHTEFWGGNGATNFTIGVEFAKFETSMTTHATGKGLYFWMNDAPAVVEFKEIMVVVGDKSFDWSPAPESVQLQIDTSLSLLSDIASDNKLTPNEKQQLKREWDDIYNEFPLIRDQANDILGAADSYEDAYSYLLEYITPLLANLTTTSDIVGSTLRSYFRGYYLNREIVKKDIQRAVDTQSRSLDFMKSAVENGSTEFQGGLGLINLLFQKTLAGIVNGGMSGLEGDNVLNWGGSTYQQAIADAAKAFGSAMSSAFLNKEDGGGHLAFGKIAWDMLGKLMVGNFEIKSGAIVGKDSTFAEKIKIHTGNLKTIAELSNSWNRDASIYSWSEFNSGVDDWSNSFNSPVQISKVYYVAGTFSTVENNTQVRLSAGTHNAVMNNATLNSTSILFKISKDGTVVATNSGNLSEIQIATAGNYDVSMLITITATIPANTGNASCDIDTIIPGYVEVQQAVARTEIAADGFMSYWSNLLHFYFSQSAGITYRGAWDVTPGIGGGKAASGGGLASPWGKFPPIACNGATTKTITHQINDTNYNIIVIMTSNNSYYVTGKTATQIQVVTAGSFDFIFVRTI